MNNGLVKAREKRAAELAAGIKAERCSPMEKAAKNPRSLRAAITAKCWDCVGGDADPGPRQRVRECHISTCPLNSVRPWQKSDEETE
jgi:hypothetical protein